MYSAFRSDPIVVLTEKAADLMLGHQLLLVDIGRADLERGLEEGGTSIITELHKELNKERRPNSVWMDKVTEAIDRGEAETLYGFPANAIAMEVHHDYKFGAGGVNGPMKKKEIEWDNGETKNPVDYDKNEWADQEDYLQVIDRLEHRLVTNNEVSNPESSRGLSRTAKIDYSHAVVFARSGDRCASTNVEINRENSCGYDSHHPAAGSQLRLTDGIVLDLKKARNLSDIKTDSFSSFQAFKLALFREATVTQKLDCRDHKLLHFMLDNREELNERGLKFDYPFEEVDGLLQYRGDQDELLGKLNTTIAKVEKLAGEKSTISIGASCLPRDLTNLAIDIPGVDEDIETIDGDATIDEDA